jgi:hypothetical protein
MTRRAPAAAVVTTIAFLIAGCAGSGAGSTGGAGSGGSTGGAGGSSAAGTGGPGTGGAGGAGNSGGSTGSGGAGGGTGGAGGTGAAGTAGTIILQDNFDATAANGPADAAKWTRYPAGQESLAPAVDTARAHSAPNSARVTSTSSGLGSFLVPLAGFPVAGNAFYVRVFINWEKATTSITGHSGFIVGSAARDESGTELRLGISSKGPGGVPRLDLNLQNPSDGGGEVTRYSNGFTDGGNPGQFTGTGFQFAANTWYCVEAFFNGAAGASEFRLWIDDAEIQEMHVTDFRGSTTAAARTAWAPTYNFLKIGANDYDANLGRIWYDDVVVATGRIGCTP